VRAGTERHPGIEIEHHVIGTRREALPAGDHDELAGQPARVEVALPRVAPLGLRQRGRDPHARQVDREPAGLPARDRVADLGERCGGVALAHPEHHFIAALLRTGRCCGNL